MADQTINTLDAKFGKVTIPLKTSLAWNGEARSEGEVHKLIINVNMEGVTLKKLVNDALAQGAVKFQRTRRSADSNGVFESRESFDEYVEQLGEEVELHFTQLGHSPTDPKKAEEEFETAFASMTPEQQLAKLEELQKRTQK